MMKEGIIGFCSHHPDLILFFANIFITVFFAAIIFADKWVQLEIQAVSLFSVQAVSENILFAAGVDPVRGSMIYHSTDKGNSWEALKSMGNNLDLAVSGTGDHVCVVGTKSYCLTMTHKEDVHIEELHFRTNSRDISPIGESGFGAVGMFIAPGVGYGSQEHLDMHDHPPINGVAFNADVRKGQHPEENWKYSDLGLDINEGYFASHGSFPTATTWYVTSGAWPLRSPARQMTILSGKLNLVPGEDQHHVDYEFIHLKNIAEDNYAGAISKTIDGGKTWQKVFDSSKRFYLNKIHCYDELHCVTVGEGSKSTVALSTKDGGETWEMILQLSGDFSLHACQMINEEEIWLSGGMIVKDNLRKREGGGSGALHVTDQTYVGLYYHTTTAGRNWELKTAEGYAYDLSFFGENTGYAAVLFRDHASIEKFL